MVPVLVALLRDNTPAVARRAISSGTNLFRNTLEQVALQVAYIIQSGFVHHCYEALFTCIISWTHCEDFYDEFLLCLVLTNLVLGMILLLFVKFPRVTLNS